MKRRGRKTVQSDTMDKGERKRQTLVLLYLSVRRLTRLGERAKKEFFSIEMMSQFGISAGNRNGFN